MKGRVGWRLVSCGSEQTLRKDCWGPSAVLSAKFCFARHNHSISVSDKF